MKFWLVFKQSFKVKMQCLLWIYPVHRITLDQILFSKQFLNYPTLYLTIIKEDQTSPNDVQNTIKFSFDKMREARFFPRRRKSLQCICLMFNIQKQMDRILWHQVLHTGILVACCGALLVNIFSDSETF